MFIKNSQNKEVCLRSFEGYVFFVPPGVSAIWTPAGEQMLKVHKIESKGGTERYMTSSGMMELDNGRGIPALSEATEAEWAKEGKKLSRVERYKINRKLIPRTALIKVALQRGISQQRVTEYQIDSMIDTEAIAAEINALPIPDEIKYPANIEDGPADLKANDEK